MHAGKNSFIFTLAGKEFSAYIQQGEVIEIQSHSETHISGKGGGGAISTDASYGYSNTKGTISDIQISSTVHNSTKLWVKTPEGLEDEWLFPVDITQLSVRKGHNVCLYLIGEPTARKSLIRKFVNLSTGKATEISTPEESLKIFKLAQDEGIQGYGIGGAVLGLIPAMWVGNRFGFGAGVMTVVGAAVIFLAFGAAKQSKSAETNRTYIKSLEDIDNKVTELILSDTRANPIA